MVGIGGVNVTNSKPVTKSQATGYIRCPAGYTCTTSAITAVLVGQYSLVDSNTAVTAMDYIIASDLGGAMCPNPVPGAPTIGTSGALWSYWTTAQLLCKLTDLDSGNSTTITTTTAVGTNC